MTITDMSVSVGDTTSPQFQIVTQTVQFLPDIASPSKDTTWQVGKKVTVTWWVLNSTQVSIMLTAARSSGTNRLFLRMRLLFLTLTCSPTVSAAHPSSSRVLLVTSMSTPVASRSRSLRSELVALTSLCVSSPSTILREQTNFAYSW